MHLKKLTAAAVAAMTAMTCGCSVRSSSDAAWPTGAVSDKKALTVSIDSFQKEYKYWLSEQKILDDTAEEVVEECAQQRSTIINYLINEQIVVDQAAKLGVTLSEEDQNEVDENYNQLIEQSIEGFKSSVNAGGTTEVDGEAAILEAAEKLFDENLAACGMTRDDLLISLRNIKLTQKLKERLAEDDPVEYSDAEAQYDQIIAGIQQVYENSPADYEQDLYYKYYWLPDNSRLIKHILIKFESDDSTEIAACRENNDEAGADKAKAAALEKLRPEVEQIKEQLDNGADFDELAKQYSEDPGLEAYPNGYLVVPNGSSYYAEFQQGAYELENIGDYKMVGTDLGWHIIQYASDAVITEENKQAMRDALFQNLQENAADNAYYDKMKQWREEYAYDIAYIALDIEEPAETAESAASAAE